jgi:hypothetical protein
LFLPGFLPAFEKGTRFPLFLWISEVNAILPRSPQPLAQCGLEKNEGKSREGRSNKHHEKNTLQFTFMACGGWPVLAGGCSPDRLPEKLEAKNAATITAKDPAIKNFASQTLPKLEEHLKQAKSIEPHTTRATPKGRSQTPTAVIASGGRDLDL